MPRSVLPLTRLAALILAPVALFSCRTDVTAPEGTVHFLIDAPLCSSRLPVQFFIDSLQVGTDTFSVNLAPEHTKSSGFVTSVGLHILGARVMGGFVWPNRAITLTAGQIFTDTLPFYCP